MSLDERAEGGLYEQIATILMRYGYSFDFNDQLWMEDYVQEHKWVDIFDIMEFYHQQRLLEIKKWDA